MPHTNRKKKSSRVKRVEVKDEDGWTRVTKTSTSHTMTNSRPLQQNGDSNEPLREPQVYDSDPMEHIIPDGASVDKAIDRYKILEQCWLSSESWSVLRIALTDTIHLSAQPVSNCVLFGSGSVTGSFRGWIERHDVALTQIAVFKSVVNTIATIQGQSRPAYAQEPEYNHLDSAFLATLNINTVGSPKGFELLDKSSFAYAPGAEFDVAMRSVFAEPQIYLTHELDHYTRNEKGLAVTEYKSYGSSMDGKQKSLDDLEAEHGPEYTESYREEYENECRILERFKSDHESLKIPDLDAQDYPFHNQSIYYRAASAIPEDKAAESNL